MNNIEIIFKDIKKEYLIETIGSFWDYKEKNIISSHFFDKRRNKDVKFHQIKNISTYFNDVGTCNIFLKEISLGLSIKNALIIVSFDEISGDITINFEVEQLKMFNKLEMKNTIQMLMERLIEMQTKYKINKIILGYEPAEDDDMKILEIVRERIYIYEQEAQKKEFHRFDDLLKKLWVN